MSHSNYYMQECPCKITLKRRGRKEPSTPKYSVSIHQKSSSQSLRRGKNRTFSPLSSPPPLPLISKACECHPLLLHNNSNPQTSNKSHKLPETTINLIKNFNLRKLEILLSPSLSSSTCLPWAATLTCCSQITLNCPHDSASTSTSTACSTRTCSPIFPESFSLFRREFLGYSLERRDQSLPFALCSPFDAAAAAAGGAGRQAGSHQAAAAVA